MIMKTNSIKLVLLTLLMFSCTFIVSAQKVSVAAAANLRYALEEIKKQYEKEHPSTKIEITFGASGTLTQQILNGATFDFFMGADREFPQKLKEKGATVGPIVTYAYGKVVMWSSKIDLSKGLTAVLSPDVKKIAIANPVGAPYGERSVEVLKAQGLYSKIEDKIVWGESITQTAQFAFTGNAEIGFIALSLAKAPEMKDKGRYYEIPAIICPPMEQACVLIKGWERSADASKFMKYVLSAKCNPIWLVYGYGLK